jgi:hypothetical protein
LDFALPLAFRFALPLAFGFALPLAIRLALLLAPAHSYHIRSLRERGCHYLPFALPLLPAVCVAAATCRLHCCYLPFALPLLPAVCAAAAREPPGLFKNQIKKCGMRFKLQSKSVCVIKL